MNSAKETKVYEGEQLEWSPIPEHPFLYHREICSAADADAMSIQMSSVLWEKIGVGGCVLPHYHNVAEIIHITQGKVKLLCNGDWISYQAGDSFLVPKGTIHSVVNDDITPTYQISLFVPTNKVMPKNTFFETILVPAQERYVSKSKPNV
jgi:mannose-6-phosphate isomerase-like protein (cupin superfamily)